MLFLWFFLIVEILFYWLLSNVLKFNADMLSFIFISIHSFSVVLYIFYKKNHMWKIYFTAYFIRLFTMFWDIYARDIYTLVGSGADSEGFLRTAISISRDLTLLQEKVYGNLYTKILGIIIYMTSDNRMIPHYLNVVLGFSIIVLADKILREFKVENKIYITSLLLLSFLPISIIHSGILLRENAISFLLLLSFYQFLKWMETSSTINIVNALLLVLVSSIMHSATIVLAVGYLFAYIFYDKAHNKLRFHLKSVIAFAFSITLVIIILSNEDIFLGKFSKMESVSDLNEIAVTGLGGSTYLTGVNIDNPVQLMIFSPLKILYFLASPMPLNWRGLNDIITFFMDGFVYLVLSIQIMKYFRISKKKKYPMVFLGLSILTFLFVFGIGINNAGTALRHRNKIFPLIVILWAVLKSQVKKERYH